MTQSDERALIGSARTMAQSAMLGADEANAAALQGKVAWIADVTITYNTLISLNLAPRTATFSITAAKAGDRVYAHRRGRPTLAGVNVLAGVMIEGTGLVPVDGTVEVYHTIPAVGVGQTLLIPLKLVGLRPASV